MNQKMMIGIIIVVVLIIGAVAFIMTKQPANGPGTSTVDESQSLASLLAGGSQQCDFDYLVGETQSQGTMYIANGMARGDFSAAAQGRTIVSHMIIRDEMMYTWQDGVSTGVKLSTAAGTTDDSQADAQQPFDVDQALDYDCRSWSADSAQFELPTDVTFTDFSAIVGGNAGADAALPADDAGDGAATPSQCAACDQVPAGESRDACLATLGC